jgi:acyl-coenzyme A synthetase/AMP-(fatty) acid ligase
VLLATVDQFTAASAFIQLDGVARRIVLYPPDLSREHIGIVAEIAGADVIVADKATAESSNSANARIVCSASFHPESVAESESNSPIETEWILLTSGTTGRPKLVQHTLESLTGAIEAIHQPTRVWSTFYDIRRYGGLQIFLRAALEGTPLVLKSARETTMEFLRRASTFKVTHILGTPSHWRRALMSPSASLIAPHYVRLSGEIADQAILNNLSQQYPQASIAHAFASTEAGVAFVVEDGLMGFPSDMLSQTTGVEMNAESGTLKVRSNRTATRYLLAGGQPLLNVDGFVDTGDALELRDGRFYFAGRRDGVINVGGLKVYPEEVESVINRHPNVSMSFVRSRRNPVMGAIVVADVVLRSHPQPNIGDCPGMQQEILQFCRGELALHKVPAAINFVPSLEIADTGKMVRHHA